MNETLLLRFAVMANVAEKKQTAKKLAAKLSLAYHEEPAAEKLNHCDYLLLFTHTGLCLERLHTRPPQVLQVDFVTPKFLHRLQHANKKNEALVKAMGNVRKENINIVDATAGLGRDSMILASLGFHVTMLERSPILHALLADGLARAQESATLAKACKHLQLVGADANVWLEKANPTPDIIYLDPMFPERQKKAAVKKEMVILQHLLGKTADAEKLLKTALTCAKKRVVVKRPRLAQPLGLHKPNYSLEGKSSRFDIYLAGDEQ